MGIAASKVVCYTAFGGVDPSMALPITIDAGACGAAQRGALVQRSMRGMRVSRLAPR